MVLVVAAMLGAAGASLLTATSRRMRAAAVSQLPTVIFRCPDGEDAACIGSEVGGDGDAVSLLRGLSFSGGGAVLEHMDALTSSIADHTAADFLAYLSDRDPQMFSDVQVVCVCCNFFLFAAQTTFFRREWWRAPRLFCSRARRQKRRSLTDVRAHGLVAKLL